MSSFLSFFFFFFFSFFFLGGVGGGGELFPSDWLEADAHDIGDVCV